MAMTGSMGFGQGAEPCGGVRVRVGGHDDAREEGDGRDVAFGCRRDAPGDARPPHGQGAAIGQGALGSGTAQRCRLGDEADAVPRTAAEPTPLTDPHELGRLGEEIAARYLESRGLEVLCRNWRCPSGEADIVARDDEEDVLVEVKTRLGRRPEPFSSIDGRKKRRYREIGLWYLMENRDVGSVRFDAVAVNVVGDREAHVRHALGVFSWDS